MGIDNSMNLPVQSQPLAESSIQPKQAHTPPLILLNGRSMGVIDDPAASSTTAKVDRISKEIPVATAAPTAYFTAVKQSPTSLTRQIQQTIDKMNLDHIATHVGDVKGGYDFKTLDTSMNPVTKLDVHFYIKKESVPTTLQVDREALQSQFSKAFIDFGKGLKPHEQGLKNEVNGGMQEIQQVLSGSEEKALSKEEMDSILKNIGTLKSKITDSDLSIKDVNKGCLFYENLQGIMRKNSQEIQLKGIPKCYEKDQLIGLLHRLHQFETEKEGAVLDPEQYQNKADRLLEAIANIRDTNENPGSYLSAQKIEDIGDSLVENGVIDGSYPSLSSYLDPYISTAHIMAKNNYDPQLMTLLKSAAEETSDRPTYAYKTGLENRREMLAQKILGSVGLDRFVLAKTDKTMVGAILKNEKNPEGIASRWVEGSEFMSPEWKEYQSLRKEYEVKIAKGENPEQAHQALLEAREKIFKQGGLESCVNHFFVDMIFGANDSHGAQYKVGADGEVYNFDWAQFMNPHFAYKTEGQTFMTLRSVMLDHPIVDQPIGETGEPGSEVLQAMREKILNMDMESVVEGWRNSGFIGDQEFFEERKKGMESCIQDRSICLRAVSNKEVVMELAAKYGIEVDPNKSEKEMKNEVSKGIEKKYWGLKKDCLDKIHPKAVDEMQKRMGLMQDYFKTEEAPTLKGAWNAYYPELKTFLNVLGRLETHPGQNFAVRQAVQSELKSETTEVLRERAATSKAIRKESSIRPETKAKVVTALRRATARFSGVSTGSRPMQELYNAEFLDSKHRYGADILPFYQVWNSTKGSADSFSVWMDKLDRGEPVPGSQALKEQKLLKDDGKPIEMRTVTYLSDQERGQYQLKINENGQFYTDKGGVLESKGSLSHIFALGQDGEFYVEEYKQGSFNHSSFFSGRPVDSAGRMQFVDGKLICMKDHSGHYHPTDEMTLKALKKLHQLMGDDRLQRMEVQFVLKNTACNGSEALRMLENDKNRSEQALVKTRRSLESVLIMAKKGGVATEQEIKEMGAVLAKIREECATLQDLRTVNSQL